MRVLFLDFDGVLHPLGLQVEAGRFVNGKPVAKPVQVDYFCWLGLLEELLAQHPDVGLVAHTSWRESHTEEALGDYLGPLRARYLGATRADLPKYESVLHWVRGHPQVKDYRILDDAQAEFPHDPVEDRLGDVKESPYGPAVAEFILCDYRTGIAEPGVQAQLRAWLTA